VRAPEEAVGGGGPIWALDVEIVDGGQRRELAVTEAMAAVVIQRELAVAPLDTGGTALEEVSAAAGDRFDGIAGRRG
jgi:hypothetical protein